jgi:hypothetical protein
MEGFAGANLSQLLQSLEAGRETVQPLQFFTHSFHLQFLFESLEFYPFNEPLAELP